MSESANSPSIVGTPQYITTKFSKPIWEVYVGSILISDAILQTVNLGFGNDISNAVFTLPRHPYVGIHPGVGESVSIIVNGKTIFAGKISVRTNHIGTDGLKITYTAASSITDFNRKTVLRASFNSDGADHLEYGKKGRVQYSAYDILKKLNVPIEGVPDVYPGAVDVTDQTELSAAESVLSKIGNYKVYSNSSSLSVYKLGSGGTNTRSFIIGKNVVSTNLTTSIENIVDKVTIVGGIGQHTIRQTIGTPWIYITPDGKKAALILSTGRNIRGISVEGLTREQPKITYDAHVEVNKAMLTGVTPPEPPPDISDTNAELNDGNANNTINNERSLKPKIKSMETYETSWSQLGVNITNSPPAQKSQVAGIPTPETLGQMPLGPIFSGTFDAANTAFVTLPELPKIWEAKIISGLVPNEILGIEAEGSQQVEIVDKFEFKTGTVRVTYTVDIDKPEVSVGSSGITRSISDSQFQIIINDVTGENNSTTVLADMTRRAQAEYDQTHPSQTTGTITVLGDETIDLRQTISIGGETLDILHVTHNFINGFTTDVTLTNEKFRKNFVARADLKTRTTTNVDTENDRRRTSDLMSQESKALKEKEKQAESEAKKNNEPPDYGAHAVFK